MADEIRPARSIAASPPAKQRRLAGVAPAKSTPNFVSLPESILNKVFDILSVEPGTAGYGEGARDAFHLAVTCRQLYSYYRCSYVHKLRLYIEPSAPSDILFRALDRLPRVTDIELEEIPSRAEGHSSEAYLYVLRETASMHKSRSLQSRMVGIKSLTLYGEDSPPFNESRGRGTEVGISAECVRITVETFSGLDRFCMRGCFPAYGDDAFSAIAEHLSSSLQTLSMCGLGYLSDRGGVRIGELRRLKSLELRSCLGVTDATFDALSALEELETLELYDCSISGAAACRLFPHLRKLTTLGLAWCRSVTGAIFSFLPRSLVTLDVRRSGAVGDGVPQSALEDVTSLTSFHAANCPIVTDLSFLWPVAMRLRRLHLSGMSASDTNVAHWVYQMPNLEELDLSESVVSDETASAISTLSKITEARLRRTQISNDGVLALARGIACQSLVTLDLQNCAKISLEDGAVSTLSQAIYKKGYGCLYVTDFRGQSQVISLPFQLLDIRSSHRVG